MEEIFKKHPINSDYEGSNFGNIRTTNWYKKGGLHSIKESTSFKGYKFFNMHGKTTLSHRFIYECFNQPIKEGYEIDHINGDPSDNRPENLREVSHVINTNNPITIKRYLMAKNNLDKTRTGVYDIDSGIITIYPTFRSAAKALKISRETIRRAIEEKRSKSKAFLPELSGLILFPCDASEILNTFSAGNDGLLP